MAPELGASVYMGAVLGQGETEVDEELRTLQGLWEEIHGGIKEIRSRVTRVGMPGVGAFTVDSRRPFMEITCGETLNALPILSQSCSPWGVMCEENEAGVGRGDGTFYPIKEVFGEKFLALTTQTGSEKKYMMFPGGKKERHLQLGVKTEVDGLVYKAEIEYLGPFEIDLWRGATQQKIEAEIERLGRVAESLGREMSLEMVEPKPSRGMAVQVKE